jgi:tRNA 2-thiouridine synthesizing protein E
MSDLETWSPRKASAIAASLGRVLSEEHWEVIFALREHYRSFGPTRARQLTLYLEDLISQGHGRKALYELFPGGPVLQGSMIAGLPRPAGAVDPSFGSVQ